MNGPYTFSHSERETHSFEANKKRIVSKRTKRGIQNRMYSLFWGIATLRISSFPPNSRGGEIFKLTSHGRLDLAPFNVDDANTSVGYIPFLLLVSPNHHLQFRSILFSLIIYHPQVWSVYLPSSCCSSWLQNEYSFEPLDGSGQVGGFVLSPGGGSGSQCGQA